MTIGIIGGSGLYGMQGLSALEGISLSTPFGEPSAPYMKGKFDGHEVIFLARHGVPHRIAPHKVNYRANIWGFKELGVQRIISVSAVGGISPEAAPGSLVLPDQIIDMTQGARPSTFYEADRVIHVDFTSPYCPEMRERLLQASRTSGIPLKNTGTYLCVNGPRLETAAEIRYFSRIGADVVGMTAMPEAVLARELEICFAGISVVTNAAAGISENKLTTTEVVETMQRSAGLLEKLLLAAIPAMPAHRACTCKDALKDAAL
jgi:5'-methylthioadenosine phosphorylase